MKPESNSSLRCSFCQKYQDDVRKLISNPNEYPRVFICDECVRVCYSILDDDKVEAPGSHTLQEPV